MIIVGIDPSLTATGIAVLRTTGGPLWCVTTVKSKPTKNGGPGSMLTRIHAIAEYIDSTIVGHSHSANQDVAWIALEAPAFSKNTGMAHERAGLWWHLYAMLSEHAPVVVVKPNVRAKYATGRGNAGKDEVMLAVAKRYPDAGVANNNEADAVVLAAMGARYGGTPIESTLPAAHQLAMKTVG